MNHPSSPCTRREALRRLGVGFGMTAFAGMLPHALRAAEASRPAKAKHVIFLFMNGGVSQVDTFDPKPMLDRHHGQSLPGSVIETERKTGTLLRSPFRFQKHGQSGIEVSEIFPHVGSCVDDICVIRSMVTDVPNHEPSLLMMNTGSNQPGRPSLGSWLTYGLGIENESLPGFVVLCPVQPTVVGPPLWSSGFLPAIHQGTYISDRVPRRERHFDAERVLPNLNREEGSSASQAREIELLRRLERDRGESLGADIPLEATIRSMETAYRMQTEAPEVFDVSRETEATRALYGPGHTARGCLTAVRLVERGVRCVQVYYGRGDPWDDHDDIRRHRIHARESDQAFAAVIRDLKSRGLFEETLVVCATEFGRTPVCETGGGDASGRAKSGRDHNPHGFSIWLAGAGVRGGMTYGATDDFGFRAVENPVHVHDLHATILHLMGLDHEQLTYRYSGRDFRLTDVHGRVTREILA
ncbi:MAG: DUF1501 domain-containing protein [Planctomycetota bacterium]